MNLPSRISAYLALVLLSALFLRADLFISFLLFACALAASCETILALVRNFRGTRLQRAEPLNSGFLRFYRYRMLLYNLMVLLIAVLSPTPDPSPILLMSVGLIVAGEIFLRITRRYLRLRNPAS